MFRSYPFIAELLSVILGVVIVVVTLAFVTIPYALEQHPGEFPAVAASAQNIHPT
jgi:uncharacterized membrane protein